MDPWWVAVTVTFTFVAGLMVGWSMRDDKSFNVNADLERQLIRTKADLILCQHALERALDEEYTFRFIEETWLELLLPRGPRPLP